jgi:hypothetical protein
MLIEKPFYETHKKGDHEIAWRFPCEIAKSDPYTARKATTETAEFQRLKEMLKASGAGLSPKADTFGFDGHVEITITTTAQAEFPIAVAFLKSVFARLDPGAFGRTIDDAKRDEIERQKTVKRAEKIVEFARRTSSAIRAKAQEHVETVFAVEIEAARAVIDTLQERMDDEASRFAAAILADPANLPEGCDDADKEAACAVLASYHYTTKIPTKPVEFLFTAKHVSNEDRVGFLAAALHDKDKP